MTELYLAIGILILATTFGIVKQQQVNALRAESARKDTQIQGHTDELAGLRFDKKRLEHANSQLEGEKRVEQSRSERQLKEARHREAVALRGWQHADKRTAKVYSHIGSLRFLLAILRVAYFRTKDENATLRQTTHNLLDIADGYADEGEELLVENERLKARVQELEDNQQTRPAKGRFGTTRRKLREFAESHGEHPMNAEVGFGG